MLILPESLLLIALKDQKGTVLFTAATVLPYSIIGAVLTELYIKKYIGFSDGKLEVISNEESKIILNNEILNFMKTSKKRDMKSWLLKINNNIKDIKGKTLNHLVDKKVLGKETSKMLGFLSKTIYPTLDPEPEEKLRSDIRKFVLDKETPDFWNIALLALVQVSQLLEDIFSQGELRLAKDRISELIDRTHEGEAISAEQSRFIKSLVNAIAEASGTSGSV